MRVHKETLVFSLISLIFLSFYIDMIFSLPLFGDATIHGSITKEIIDKGISQTVTTYPLLYNTFQAILYLIFGEKGMNLIVFLGVLLISFSIFLLAKEITGKATIGFLSMIILLAFPKLIFYSARMYMEILLSGFFIYAIFLMIRFMKTQSSKYLILLTFFIAIAASLKQQGIFILFTSVVLFFLVFSINEKMYRGRNNAMKLLKYSIVFFFLFIVIVSPIYLALFHSAGSVIPGNEDYVVISLVNDIGQKISGYQKTVEDIKFDVKYGLRLQEIQNDKYSIASTRAESRHIFATDVLTSLDKNVKIHGLYLENFAGGHTDKKLSFFMNSLMYIGIILFILNIYFKNKILKFNTIPLQKWFLIFLIIFLVNNYLLFARNNDQMRYHLFIAILFSIFSAISIYFISRHIIGRLNVNKNLKLVSISLFLIIIFIQLLTLTSLDSEWNKRWDHSQIYSSSKGGIASIQEVGTWINNHTNEDDLIWQMSGNELQYYSGRKVTGRFEYYFLNESELNEIFADQGISYIVIFDSQVVSDEKWTHFGWVPKSFENRIEKLYPIAYTSSFNDINVYRV